MKLKDVIFFGLLILLFIPFFVFIDVFKFYDAFNKDHPIITSFIKFAILATTGECIGHRIKTGNFHQKGFGLIPRAIVWGFLGIVIQMVFVIFSVLLIVTGIFNFIAIIVGELMAMTSENNHGR